MAAPVNQSERIIILDSLGGIAILGILLMNMPGFALPVPVQHDPSVLNEWGKRSYTMKRIIISAILIVGLYSCDQPKKAGNETPALYDSSYQSAVFADASRLEKIKAAFPVIDSLYKSYATENHFPGLAFGIVVDGKLVYTGNCGFTDIEKKTPVTSSSLFRIASMSKSFTAMAILKLRDEGKLNLDDPAYLYIPQLKNIKYPTADAPLITVRHWEYNIREIPKQNK